MIQKFTDGLHRFVRDEEGLETVEYAIIAGLVVVGTIASISAIGTWVAAQYQALQAALGA